MNILLLTHSYPNKVNPLKCIFIKEQAKALSTFCEVTVVVFRIDFSTFSPISGYSFSKYISGNLTEYEVIVTKSLPVITQLKYLIATYRFIKNEILSKKRPDIIHSHLSYPGGFLGTILQQKEKIPNILTEHSRISSFSRSCIHKLCVKYTLRKAHSIIAVSNSLKTEIIQIARRPVAIIPNFADSDKFNLRQSSSETAINIGFIGGMGNNNKGLDLLLNAVSLLKRKDVILHIGGFGSLLEDFRKMAYDFGIGKNCIFYGEISREEILDFYSHLNFFVLPSRYETFGIVLIEAMSCGLPVIATRCGGPQDIVLPFAGELIEKDNQEELVEAIKRMIANLGSYNKVAIRNYAIEKFGQSAFIESITSLYQDVLKKN
jgi:L-malate glycosyltransferase